MFKFLQRAFSRERKTKITQKDEEKVLAALEKTGFLKGPMLGAAIASTSRNYWALVNEKKKAFPSYKEKDLNVRDLWEDLRIETCSYFYMHVPNAVSILSDDINQRMLLKKLLEDRPHLMMPQPSGDDFDQVIQGVWQGYLYMIQAATPAGDRYMDKYRISLQKIDPFEQINEAAAAAAIQWQGFPSADHYRNGLPPTLLQIIYDDITVKTKSIALSHIWGPSYEENMSKIVEDVRTKNGSQEADLVRRKLDIVLAARQPDDVLASAALSL